MWTPCTARRASRALRTILARATGQSFGMMMCRMKRGYLGAMESLRQLIMVCYHTENRRMNTGTDTALFELSGYLNNLWRYRYNDSTWTWMTGSSWIDSAGNGTVGVPSIFHFPGARSEALTWFDSLKREVWLLGGYPGFGSVSHRQNEHSHNVIILTI